MSSFNCLVCAGEFDQSESKSVVFSNLNTTNFKICQSCLDASDPTNDYREARNIIASYTNFSVTKAFYKEAKKIIKNIKK